MTDLDFLLRGSAKVLSREDLVSKLAEGRPLRVKLGVDPTAPDIHLGHSISLSKLRDFQDAGHEGILIIGDFTAMIGDPSGRSVTRPQLSHAQVLENARSFQEQAFKILDRQRTRVVFNGEWFQTMGFQDVIRLNSRVTLQQMLVREDFRERIDKGLPVRAHEIQYPIMQGWDSVMTRADVELGGTDQLFNLKDFPEGELMRILEFNVSKNDDMSKTESDSAFNGMYENYGIAGEMFIRYVIANLPEVKEMITKIQRKFDKAAGITQRERFWSATVACALTAGIITKKLNLHNIDVGAIYQWAVETIGRMRVEVRPGVTGPLAHLGLFLNRYNNNMLIINSTVDKRSGLTEAPVREPRGELISRFEPDTKQLFISVKILREWCSENQVSYKALVDDLNSLGAGMGIVKKAMSRGSDMSTPAVSALVVDCAKATVLNPEDNSLPSPSYDDTE
jgi:hypothetical protein